MLLIHEKPLLVELLEGNDWTKLCCLLAKLFFDTLFLSLTKQLVLNNHSAQAELHPCWSVCGNYSTMPKSEQVQTQLRGPKPNTYCSPKKANFLFVHYEYRLQIFSDAYTHTDVSNMMSVSLEKDNLFPIYRKPFFFFLSEEVEIRWRQITAGQRDVCLVKLKQIPRQWFWPPPELPPSLSSSDADEACSIWKTKSSGKKNENHLRKKGFFLI